MCMDTNPCNLFRFNILRLGTVMELRWKAWYHTLISWNVYRIVLIFIVVNFTTWLVMAGLLYGISDQCDLDIHNYGEALVLAIISMSTIGYGVRKDPYLNGCSSGIIILAVFVMWGLILDALIIGIIMQRVSRGQRRATTVCFTDKAIIRVIDNQVYFILQVCEMRKHQLIEAHVRLFCIRETTTAGGTLPIPFQTFTMRLQQPDDELGGMLLLAMPQQIVHRVDSWSPLMPPPPAGSQRSGPDNPRWHLSTRYTYPGVLQRQVDVETGNREARDGNQSYTALVDAPLPSLDVVREHMIKNNCEVVVLVEGIDAVTRYVIERLLCGYQRALCCRVEVCLQDRLLVLCQQHVMT